MSDTLPPEEQWQRASKVGERVIRTAIQEKIMRRLQRGAHPYDALAMMFGAMTSLAQATRALSKGTPEATSVLEQNILAYVRGAIRGLDGPVNEDGSPFTGARL